MKKLNTKKNIEQKKAKWSMVKLGDVCDVRDGTHESPKYLPLGIPFITSKNLKNNKIDFSSTQFISKKDHESFSRRSRVDNGDILFGMIGTIGNPVVVSKDREFSIKNVALFKFRNNKKIINHFLQLLLSSSCIKNNLIRRATGGSQKFVSLTDLRNFKVPLPSLPEQNRIVEILSTWNQAIEKLDKLISVKQKQFKWLLKKLITDQKNNPEWKKEKLGELGLVSSSGVDKKVVKNEESVRLVNYLDVLNKNFICSEDLNHWVTAPKSKINKCNVKRGDVFFTPSSEIHGDIAHSSVAIEDIESAVYSYHIIRFRLRESWDIMFRGYIFKSEHFYKQAYSICQGSGQRYVISQDDFRKMDIYFPSSILEQKRIANIFNTKEIEIKALKQLSEKYQEQKKGLMQQLLTGKTRLQ